MVGLIVYASVTANNTLDSQQKASEENSKDESGLTSISCLDEQFEGSTGILKAHSIQLDFTGRISIGDLNSDTHPDFVISNRDQLAAYDLCGKKLWDIKANTNWDNPSHVYWNWTSYGYIGDADGDGNGEYLHIGSDWRTLYVRDGLTGAIEHEIDLGTETSWMYVLLGNRGEEADDSLTRIFVTGRPGHNKVKAIDIRNGTPKIEWFFNTKRPQHNAMAKEK